MVLSVTSSLFVAPSLSKKAEDASANAVALTPAQQKKKDDAQALVNQLHQVRESMISNRKGDARQKLDQAKEKLRMLRLMGGDPKQVARQAAQIAREVRAAAQEYSSALRESGASSAVDASAAVSAANEAKAASLANPNAAAEADVSTTAVPTQTAADQDKDAQKQTPAEAKPITPEEVKKAYQDAANAIKIKGAEAQAERENLREFKDVAREAKRIIDEAARKLKEKKPGDNDAREAENAARQMQQAVSDMAKTVGEFLNPVSANDGAGVDVAVNVDTQATTVSLLI